MEKKSEEKFLEVCGINHYFTGKNGITYYMSEKEVYDFSVNLKNLPLEEFYKRAGLETDGEKESALRKLNVSRVLGEVRGPDGKVEHTLELKRLEAAYHTLQDLSGHVVYP